MIKLSYLVIYSPPTQNNSFFRNLPPLFGCNTKLSTYHSSYLTLIASTVQRYKRWKLLRTSSVSSPAHPSKLDCRNHPTTFKKSGRWRNKCLLIFRLQACWSCHRVLAYWWIGLRLAMCKEREMSIIQLFFWPTPWQENMSIERSNTTLEANRLQSKQGIYLLWKR